MGASKFSVAIIHESKKFVNVPMINIIKIEWINHVCNSKISILKQIFSYRAYQRVGMRSNSSCKARMDDIQCRNICSGSCPLLKLDISHYLQKILQCLNSKNLKDTACFDLLLVFLRSECFLNMKQFQKLCKLLPLCSHHLSTLTVGWKLCPLQLPWSYWATFRRNLVV